MVLKKTAMAMVIMLGAGMAQAEVYIGINAGKSSAKESLTESDIDAIFISETGSPADSRSIENSDSSFKIFMGTPTSENVDIRFGYTSLGEITAKGESSSLTLGGLDHNVQSQGLFADIVAKFKPVDRLALYGKLGLAFMRTEMTVRAYNATTSAENSVSSSSLVLVPGLGLSVDITSSFGLAVELERYMSVGDQEKTGQSDVDVASAGLYFRF